MSLKVFIAIDREIFEKLPHKDASVSLCDTSTLSIKAMKLQLTSLLYFRCEIILTCT